MAGLPHWAKMRPISADSSYSAGLHLGICREEEDTAFSQSQRNRHRDGPCLGLAPAPLPLPTRDLLSLAPADHELPTAFSWMKSSGRSCCDGGESRGQGIDVNQMPSDDEAAVSSPNSTVSSFHVDEGGLSCSADKRERGSDEEDGDNTRKKLRLSKDQSALLEESFRKHNTLNPKQKIALAKQLSLRPRQVEVWFQNRRARTKLKQTEVDCEFLKRCCENLTEENRRLQKELQELRALKVATPFYMQLPAATLTMCPSCERVATANTRRLPWQPMPNSTTARTVQPPARS
ncbi:hypothetical protein KI387_001747 [Taxus chinensis]|uniref:Homeobox domain-containing protein n=1 Tax=Taxus chinensis TaxID=29808 RepID=A0AA38GV73_TAXCH|nr:hypothetical protein KI387_001747 [Taxus chinensis]